MIAFAGRALLTVALFAALWLPAAAQNFPSQPVKLIVPWPPGGSSDVVLRALADATTKHFGQPITIENKAGATGTIGAATVAGVKPDGYVITQMPVSVYRLPFMNKVNFDPLRDFTYIIHLTGYPFGVAVREESPWKSFPGLAFAQVRSSGKVFQGESSRTATPNV